MPWEFTGTGICGANDMKLTREQAADIIARFLAGGGNAWEWDDFISVPVKGDPVLNAIRLFCNLLRDIYPPTKSGEYCNGEGIQVLHRIETYLRSTHR
jgi:hypothetical protein